jgi:hypothetical protein
MFQESNPDRVIKCNIEQANLQTCLDTTKQLNLYRYMWIDAMKDRKKDTHQIGLMSDEVKTVLPNSVFDIPFKAGYYNSIQNVNLEQIHMAHLGATQKLIQIVEEQQSTIQQLKEEMSTLRQLFHSTNQ